MSRGGKRVGAGRPKGALGTKTVLIRNAVLEAAEAVGEDGNGKDGLVGYLKDLAINERKSFATLLSRAMPMQVEASADGAGEPVTVKIQYVGAKDERSRGLKTEA